MAEKYGEKPRRFSAKWFEYIWNYYKWYIAAVIAAALFAVITLHEIKSTPGYDVTLTIAGDYLYSDSDVEKIKSIINSAGEDVNGDGSITSDVYQMVYVGDSTVDTAYDTKLALSLQESDMLLYLMDKERFDRIIEQSFGDELFTPIEEWYGGGADGGDLYYSDGKAYGVKVLSGSVFKENGLTEGDLYIAVRKNYRSSEKTQKLYKACKRIAGTIADGGLR